MHFYVGTFSWRRLGWLVSSRRFRHKVLWPALHANAGIDRLAVLAPAGRNARAIKDAEGVPGHPEEIRGCDPICFEALKELPHVLVGTDRGKVIGSDWRCPSLAGQV